MTKPAGGRVGKRLKRILILLPYAIRHPGVSVDELAKKFGVKRSDLFDDLNLVFMCGLPGYGPGDLIDVSLEEDRVYVRMADYFGMPLRLTPAEALALYAGGQALSELPDMAEADALRGGLRKLGRALGASEGEAAGISVELQHGPDHHLSVLRQALVAKKQVDLEYFSASRGVITRRTVDPWGLIAALGRWYLVAHDYSSSDERMFRTDRMKRVEMKDTSVGVEGNFEAQRYRGAFSGIGDTTVVLEISPAAARWFEDYYPVVRAETLADGWRRVEFTTGGEMWGAMLLLRLGRDARSVAPAALVIRAKELAATISQRHLD